MSTSKPLLVVVGATGQQGGSVVSHILSLPDQPYRLRGITRNTKSEAAQALSRQGVEVVSGNLDDVDSLIKAFEGANAIFTVTDFWNPFRDPEQQAKAAAAKKHILVHTYEYERQQGKNIFDAASKIDSLERLVYSSLSDVTKWSGGKYVHVYHFDSKAHAAEYGKTTYPDLWKKTSLLQVGFYLTNFLPTGGFNVLLPRKDSSGVLNFTSLGPSDSCPLPFVAPEEDTGPLTYALLQAAPGKNLIGTRQWADYKTAIAAFGCALGVQAQIAPATEPNIVDATPEVLREEFDDFTRYAAEFGYDGYDGGKGDTTVVQPEDLGVPLNLPSLDDWFKKQDWSSIL